MTLFMGTEIIVVEPGTVIEHEGQRLTVTETEYVILGAKIFMTSTTLEALKVSIDIPAPTPWAGFGRTAQ